MLSRFTAMARPSLQQTAFQIAKPFTLSTAHITTLHRTPLASMPMLTKPQLTLAPLTPSQVTPVFTPHPLFTLALRFGGSKKTLRTYQPSVQRRKQKHGFLKRLRSVGGRRVLTNRRLKGRQHVAV